ncbi:MAG: hypothetical protein IT384_06790 [Deltaproteobacteria bacterium]|nr:hypothetical protein [Deltaproteobacteria bacterium]
MGDAELARLARKYVWWEEPPRALARRVVFLCQIMQLGTWEDLRTVRDAFGEAALKQALQSAPPGVLDARSWNFWNRFFGFVPVPPEPTRALP